jgi:ribosomal protein S18 acetylase RimI-like enzyme
MARGILRAFADDKTITMDLQKRQAFGPIIAILKDGSAITLRLLEPADADALGDFYESVPREDYRHYAPHPLNREQANIKAGKLADSPYFICIIAANTSGQIAGYAWVDWKKPDDECCSLGICIRREYQGLGTGAAIMTRLLEVVGQAGPARVQLTVHKTNPRAFSLYQKMGFETVREQMRPKFEEFAAEPVYFMERRSR